VSLREAIVHAEPALPGLRVLRTASQAQLPLKFDRANPQRPGICIEIIHALSRVDTGLRFEGLARELPLKRVVQELANDELDLFFSLIPTEDRKRQVDFLDGPPLYESRHQLAVRADDPVDVRNIDDLRALGPMGLVLTTHGTAYSEFLQQFDGIALYPQALSNEQNLRMLLAGRGRFFYHAGSTLRHHIDRLGLQNQVRILPAVFKVDEQRVGCSRRLPLAVRQRVSVALQRLWISGELLRLRQKYGVT
jgi:glutamate/aspartate transport system substrate-binding protein